MGKKYLIEEVEETSPLGFLFTLAGIVVFIILIVDAVK